MTGSCSALVLFLRLLTLPPDTEELEVAKAAHQNCVPASELDAQIKQREEAHTVELQRERDEASWLKLEIEKSQCQKTEVGKALAEEKQLRVDEANKHQEILDETEQRANLAQNQLDALKEKPAQWQKDLDRINSEMTSKLLFSLSCSRPIYGTCAGMRLNPH